MTWDRESPTTMRQVPLTSPSSPALHWRFWTVFMARR